MQKCNREIRGNNNIIRFLFRFAGKESVSNLIQTAEIDQWIEKSININNNTNKQEFELLVNELNEYLQLRSYLNGYNIKSSDLSLWTSLKSNPLWTKLSSTISPPNNGPINVLRWLKMVENSKEIQSANEYVIKQQQQREQRQAKSGKSKKSKKSQQQKPNPRGSKKKAEASASWVCRIYISYQKFLENIKWINLCIFQDIGISKEYQGKIVTRFPPEPSGFLHIGHAKAVFINSKVAEKFGGKMLVRIDDTNPTKEKAEYEENILRDLQTLGIKDNKLSHTSDYFPEFKKYCTKVIKNGKAYCDQTPSNKMKEERSNRTENKYRSQSVDENLRLWNEMINGTPEGIKTCVRMKLDMKSDNGTLRDPTIYRCNIHDSHHRTGKKFKVYPTYDFACPIVDTIEGVTHAFRSKEYNERNEQYKQIWNIVFDGDNNNNYVLPNIFQFSRLEFVRTVLSKRKLGKLVERGVVDGWNDPRLPTVQGIFRRGLQLGALERFVMDQAMSVVNTQQEWDKIWSYNADILDEEVGRYFAVSEDYVVINIKNIENKDKFNKSKIVPLAPPKYQKLKGKTKILEISDKVYVERWSVNQAIEKNKKKNETRMILMNWGIINIDKINYNEENKISSIDAKIETENKNFKGKQTLIWVADNGLNNLVPVKLVELDYLFNAVEKPKEDEEKKMEIVLEENTSPTWYETKGFAESSLRLLNRGDIIQFIKFGFFIVDKPYLGRKSEPAVLINIPDGKEKKMSKVWEYLSKCESSTR